MVLVPELGGLALALFCLALALAATIIVKSLISSMGGVPLIGRVISAILSPIAHALSWAAGQLETGVDAILGATLATFAKVMEWTFDFYKAQAVALLQLAHLVGSGLYNVSGLRSIVHRLEREWHGIEHGIKSLRREVHGIERDVRTLEREVGHGIGNDVLPRVRSLERKLGRVENKVIPAIQSGEAALADDISALGEYIRANFLSSATDAVTAAVAVALASLGLGGLRCNNFKGLLNKFGCGLGSILNDLIGLALSVLALESVCTFLPLLEEAFGAVVGPMVHLLNEVPLGACEKRPSGWATLNAANGPVPPPQSLGTLPQE